MHTASARSRFLPLGHKQLNNIAPLRACISESFVVLVDLLFWFARVRARSGVERRVLTRLIFCFNVLALIDGDADHETLWAVQGLFTVLPILASLAAHCGRA
jgi:hypothetical protein